MTPYPIGLPVTVTTIRDGAICRVSGQIRGRTLEDSPRYDVKHQDGWVINAPHADLERAGPVIDGWPLHVGCAA